MKKPEQALTLRPVTIGSKTVPADERVWVWERSSGFADVEHGDHRGKVPEDALTSYPVPPPSLGELRRLDACFGLPDAAFEREHIDHDWYFEILRCKAHGRRFLRDVCGGVLMYTRLILLTDEDKGSPKEIWQRYHRHSDSWLHRQGRTL
jgi:hypothetical protein